MDLKTYLSTLPRGGAMRFAKALGVSKSYLSQLASGIASVSPKQARQHNKIPLKELLI